MSNVLKDLYNSITELSEILDGIKEGGVAGGVAETWSAISSLLVDIERNYQAAANSMPSWILKKFGINKTATKKFFKEIQAMLRDDPKLLKLAKFTKNFTDLAGVVMILYEAGHIWTGIYELETSMDSIKKLPKDQQVAEMARIYYEYMPYIGIFFDSEQELNDYLKKKIENLSSNKDLVDWLKKVDKMPASEAAIRSIIEIAVSKWPILRRLPGFNAYLEKLKQQLIGIANGDIKLIELINRMWKEQKLSNPPAVPATYMPGQGNSAVTYIPSILKPTVPSQADLEAFLTDMHKAKTCSVDDLFSAGKDFSIKKTN